MKNPQNESIELYWQVFLDTLSTDSPYRYRPFDAKGWRDQSLCIIETLEVTIKPYNDVAHFRRAGLQPAKCQKCVAPNH